LNYIDYKPDLETLPFLIRVPVLGSEDRIRSSSSKLLGSGSGRGTGRGRSPSRPWTGRL